MYLTFVTESEPRAQRQAALGKGYKRKNVYFTFVTESELLATRWTFVLKGRKEKKRVLDFCNGASKIRRRQNRGKREQEEKGHRIGRGCKWFG